MASTSNQEIDLSESNINKKGRFRNIKWFLLLLFGFGCMSYLIEYFATSTVSCVLYVNGKRNNTYEGKDDCFSMGEPLPLNQSIEVRPEVHFQSSYLKISGVCLLFFVVIFVCFILPHNLGNYRACCRRTTCCCRSITLREGIHRYMNGYISDEKHFKKVISICQDDLDRIVGKLKNLIPDMTFNVLMAGSLQERLGKPTFIQLDENGNLPMKSILSSDFDVMLTPETIMASRKDDPFTSGTLFNVVNSPYAPPGFVWLSLNQPRNSFWKDLCIESSLPNGPKGLFLSSFKVRNVFLKGMKQIKRNWVKHDCIIDWCFSLKDKGVIFKFKAQGPAVTVKLQERGSIFRCASEDFHPTLFYGDFIFAIRCAGWPQEAEDWKWRCPRYWPKRGVVREVLNAGYHVVPKPSIPFLKKKKKKDNAGPVRQEFEWRLSYSLAEIILSKKIPPVARACVLALKGTLKRHPLKTAGCVSSYHLKTILYWALEQNHPGFWCEERIEECFMVLVDTLLECATNRNCSHYFMPQVNIMATVQERHLECLSNFLLKLKENPVKYVSSSNLRCHSNLAAFYECMCYNHGADFYMDIY